MIEDFLASAGGAFAGRTGAFIFALLALIMILMVWQGMKHLHKTDESFDLRDLITENGRLSKGACVMMGAFGATTWQFIYFTLNGKMTEGYEVIYVAAWITPVVARLISREPTPQSATVTTTTQTTSTLKDAPQ